MLRAFPANAVTFLSYETDEAFPYLNYNCGSGRFTPKGEFQRDKTASKFVSQSGFGSII